MKRFWKEFNAAAPVVGGAIGGICFMKGVTADDFVPIILGCLIILINIITNNG